MEISAKIIAHSIANNVPLITMELNYPRFIHAEAKTHRVISLDDDQYELVLKQNVDLMDDPVLSRNASSSRAIPIEKMIRQVEENPAMPIHWGKNQPGMQAREELDAEKGRLIWLSSKQRTMDYVELLNKAGYHKQIVNRLLEPFQWIKVIVTATEWDNFFKLRDHPDAQPEIQELARCMKHAMQLSEPTPLVAGEWHLPYVTNENFTHMMVKDFSLKDVIKCSVARCARVSYNNHDSSVPDVEKDIKLAAMLLSAGHISPFEHICTPMQEWVSTSEWEKGITHMTRDGMKWSGNFRGWIQYRQLI